MLCPGTMPPHPAPSSSRSSSYSTFALAFKALLKAGARELPPSHVARPKPDPSSRSAAESSSYTDGSTYPPPVDEAHIASIVNGYINAKFARGGKTTMAHVGSKVDELERAAGQLKVRPGRSSIELLSANATGLAYAALHCRSPACQRSSPAVASCTACP